MVNVTLPLLPHRVFGLIVPRYLEGCLDLQIMQSKSNFLMLLAVFLRNFKPHVTSAAVPTYDNCFPFPSTSADLHSHCKEPKPIYLSLVSGLWSVLVAFVGPRLYVCGEGVGVLLAIGKAEDRNVDCKMSRERELFCLFSIYISRIFICFG